MQRLTQRTDGERGAVAVVVALLMVPLIGFAALAIDISSMWYQQQRLQVAADASALAIAQDCAHDASTCADTASSTAQQLTSQNFPGADIETPVIAGGTVAVTTLKDNHNVFAPMLDEKFAQKTSLQATASAAWGSPSRGTTMLPLVISACAFEEVAGEKQAIDIARQCKQDGNLPGGFGWVDSDPGICGRTSAVGDTLTPASNQGASVDEVCQEALPGLVGTVVLLPVYEISDGGGSNGLYHITRYAAFMLTGYRFPGMPPTGTLCNKNKCIEGEFIKYVTLDDAFQYSPNDTASDPLSVTIVALTG